MDIGSIFDFGKAEDFWRYLHLKEKEKYII